MPSPPDSVDDDLLTENAQILLEAGLGLEQLVPNKVYRSPSQFRLPTDPKDINHGSVYVAVTKSIQSTVEFFNRPNILMRYTSAYVLDRVYNYRIYNSLVKYRLSDMEAQTIFKGQVQPTLPHFTLVLNQSALNRKNYIYEIGPYNERFFGEKDTRLAMNRVNEYFRLFKEFTADKVVSANYPNRHMLIQLDDWISDPRDRTLYRLQNTSNWISLFYNKLANDHAYFSTNFAGWKFYFMSGNQILLWEPDTVNEKSADEFVTLMTKFRKIEPKVDAATTSQEPAAQNADATVAINKTAIADKVVEDLTASGVTPTDDAVSKIVDNAIGKADVDVSKAELPPEEVADVVETKEMELERIQAEMQNIVPKSRARLAREVKLVQEMKDVKMGDMTLGEVLARAEANTIEPVTFPIDTVNPALKEMTFPNFDEAYLKKLYRADIAKIVSSFQYKDHPLYLIDAEIKDISDSLNSLEEHTYKFEDEAGRRHTVVVNMPKFINGRFLKVGGNKKIMSNQIIPLPITKTGPDTVQIATYQKVFIQRFGQSISPKVAVFLKSIGENRHKDVKVEVGESTRANREYIRTIEYDELATKYRRIKTPNIEIFFNQKFIRQLLADMKKPVPEATSTKLPIAIRNGKDIIYLDTESSKVEGTNMQLMDFVISEIGKTNPEFEKPFANIRPGRKYMYNRAKIMEKKVPVALLLSFLDGLLSMMKRAEINYRIIAKEDGKKALDLKSGEEEAIEFEDAWLVYPMYPLRNSLLMNGFCEIPTKIYKIQEFLGKDVYFELFENLFGRKNIGYAFENFQQLLIDPVTEEVLRDYGLPTNFIDIFLYANMLLEDNSMTDDGDMSVHRARSNEAVVAFLYKALAKAYQTYRFTANNPNPVKMSVRKDAVLVDILSNQLTKDYSDLNPIYTAELKSSTTWKGIGGMNQDRAFNLSKRSYHPSMVGVLSQASPISGSIGIARTLTLDANITSARGYIKVAQNKDEINQLSTAKMISAAESLIPFGVSSDDPERTAMTSAQSRHTLACVGSERAPLGTGYEKVLPHIIGDTFVFKAKKDGTILKIDDVSHTMILKYGDGTIDTVNLSPDMGKNAGSGFFISNKLSPILEAGASFKEGAIVACNKDFFTIDKRTGNPVTMTGPLARIAIRYSSKVFEDSTIVSTPLAGKMSSDIVVKRPLTLGRNSNIDYIVKKGQEIKVNDPLIIFDTSHDDELTNKMLAKMSDEFSGDIKEASKTPVVSKHNGVIEDIKIYYTVPKEELSESARKVIDYYEAENAKVLRRVSKETGIDAKMLDVTLTEVEQVTPDATGKVKGTRVGEGLLIEIYTKYRDVFGVGDKLTSFVATKAIACDVFKEGEEPYLLSDPNDKIDAYIGVISVGARMVLSLIKTSMINGILIGAKKNTAKMYQEIYGEEL
jgi:hypothetical protein